MEQKVKHQYLSRAEDATKFCNNAGCNVISIAGHYTGGFVVFYTDGERNFAPTTDTNTGALRAGVNPPSFDFTKFELDLTKALDEVIIEGWKKNIKYTRLALAPSLFKQVRIRTYNNQAGQIEIVESNDDSNWLIDIDGLVKLGVNFHPHSDLKEFGLVKLFKKFNIHE